jgi:hypothetical protein
MFKFSRSRLYSSIIICAITIIIIVILSFILKSPNDSIVAVLSLSFTVIGALATVATLIIALMLYDQFGLKNKFIERQTDKVLELVDSLKGKVFRCKSNGVTYFIKPSQSFITELGYITQYQKDAKKIIVISQNDYETGVGKLLQLGRSYWMPKSIKARMVFLDIPAVLEVENSQIKDYIKLEFNADTDADLGIPIDKSTFESFNNNLLKLVVEIESWLQTHSGIKIDFKMEEPH